MSIVTAIRIAGVLQIALSLLHAVFPARFDWREQLPRLSLMNRQMFQVHYFFIAFIVMLFGILSAFFANALTARGLPGQVALAQVVLAGLTLFWLVRLLAQFFFYDAALWRGNRSHTVAHIAFTLLWVYLTGVYALAWRFVITQ